MSTKRRDPSAFISHLSNLSGVLSLFCGFTFTSITILLTQLSNPLHVLAQLTLFFLAAMMDLFLFLLTWTTISVIHFCEYAPIKQIQHSSSFNWLLFLGLGLWGVAIVLMFLLWNLHYLAIASAVVWLLFCIAGFTFLWKPFQEFYRRAMSS